MAGAFLSSSLQVLLDRMDSLDVLTFLWEQKFSAALLRKLKINLLAVQAVLDDAEAKQIKKPLVKKWLDDLKDAVYDAEDLMDDITTEALRCKEFNSQTTATQVRNVISASLNTFGEGIESKVEGITDTLEYLAQQKDALGLKEGVGENLSQRRLTTSLLDESGVYGRDRIKDEIVQFLLFQNASGNKVSVIALVGMGGIGKTTLTKMVYNDRRVAKCFDLKAWVCVSDEFDLVRVTKTIVEAIDKSFDSNNLNLLQLKLQETLSKKKFLLVLDDVWNENYNNWDKLLTPLAVGRNGSKIIVTTRSDRVASVMRSDRIHHLGQLSFEDCWSLFAKHAFENGDSRPHPKLKEIGEGIVRKCKGLPLAAKTLGGALYSDSRVKEWENVLNSEMWDLPSDEILPALKLSYSFLPSHLKRCFAYCSIFPKDYEFDKENLILLWMAEGLLQLSEGKKTMEEIGDGYFSDLLSRSFFQKSNSHKSYFVMHDLINDLAQLVSGKFCVQLKDGKMNEIPKKCRHLSYFRSEHDRFERFETLTNGNGLRTFLPLNLGYLPRYHLSDKVSKNMQPPRFDYSLRFLLSNRVPNDLLRKVQNLRVLSLCYYRIIDLPGTIGNLKHLRYLDLSYTSIIRLPDSICNLYNLQTLILYFCNCLVELPIMMSRLIRLRLLDIRHSKVKEMPSQMGQLKGLQKLTNYRVGKKSGTRVGELRELSHFGGSLGIQELQNVVDAEDALEANLVGKQYLDELQLEWSHGIQQNRADIVLNNLQPHSNLKRLTVYGYGGSRFPDWFGDSSILNMVSLRLWNCQNVSAFPPLGQLPSLKHLYIWGLGEIERVGAEFYGTNSSSARPSFPSLKALSFGSMPKWKKWSCLGGQGGELFPCLKKLCLEDCPKLIGDLPNHLPLLKTLQIERWEQLVAPLSQWKELQDLTITNSNSLESLLEEGMLQSNDNLQNLKLSKCSFSRPLCRICLPKTLKSFSMQHCEKPCLLPEFFKCHLPFLEGLDISHCTCSSSLSFPLDQFPMLRSIVIQNLKGLESLSISIPDRDHTSLYLLGIGECPNLVSIKLPALNFSEFSIGDCENLKQLLHNDARFESLSLENCPELIFPIRGLPSKLTSLSITNCNKLTSQEEWGLQGLASLTSLKISGLQNLSSLDCTGLPLHTCLQKLRIRDCPMLQSLTKEVLPTSLSFLTIQNCPLLKGRCKFGIGADWLHIAHIPHIVIDDQVW